MNRKQDFLKIIVIIAATPATSGDRELIIHALQDIQNDMAYYRKVFRCIILAHARVILAEGYIKAPVQGILNRYGITRGASYYSRGGKHHA